MSKYPLNTYTSAATAGIIGGVTAPIVYSLIEKYIYRDDHHGNKVMVKDLNAFKSQLTKINLDCPRLKFHLKHIVNKYLKVKDTLSEVYRNNFEKHQLESYNRISEKNEIAVDDIKDSIKALLNVVTNTVTEDSSEPILLALGENHSNQQSFLFEALVLTDLKNKGLINSLLIERDSIEVDMYKNTPLSKWEDVNIMHFAYHVLKLDLIGIDPLHQDNSFSFASEERESGMLSNIAKNLDKSGNKLQVAVVGNIHLPMLLNLPKAKIIPVNTVDVSILEKTLSLFEVDGEKSLERFEQLEKTYTLELNNNIESMTFGQILEIYEDYLLEKDASYLSKGLEECHDTTLEHQMNNFAHLAF